MKNHKGIVFTDKIVNLINDSDEMYDDNSEITEVDNTYGSGNNTHDICNTGVGASNTAVGIGNGTHNTSDTGVGVGNRERADTTGVGKSGR